MECLVVPMRNEWDVLVIGGGAAGMMAAIAAAEQGAAVCLLEPNSRLGKKLNITGKGRCNLTNNCSQQELMANIPCNGKFLYSAFSQLDSRDTMAFFESLGVPLVIMEPVKGGSLASLPDEVTAPFKDYNPEASTASWALRWVASKPNVKVVLSGMSTPEQVADNLQTFQSFHPLSLKEKELVAEVARRIKQRTRNGCTGCAYCMPCPFGVNIPQNFHIWNELAMYGNKGKAKQAYFKDLTEKERADQCHECGKCEEVCPQGLSIRENLKEVSKEMETLK